MKSKLLILVSGSVLALGACNKHDNETTNAGPDVSTGEHAEHLPGRTMPIGWQNLVVLVVP